MLNVASLRRTSRCSSETWRAANDLVSQSMAAAVQMAGGADPLTDQVVAAMVLSGKNKSATMTNLESLAETSRTTLRGSRSTHSLKPQRARRQWTF